MPPTRLPRLAAHITYFPEDRSSGELPPGMRSLRRSRCWRATGLSLSSWISWPIPGARPLKRLAAAGWKMGRSRIGLLLQGRRRERCAAAGADGIRHGCAGAEQVFYEEFLVCAGLQA